MTIFPRAQKKLKTYRYALYYSFQAMFVFKYNYMFYFPPKMAHVRNAANSHAACVTSFATVL